MVNADVLLIQNLIRDKQFDKALARSRSAGKETTQKPGNL